ncbi:hypothetical protein HPB49_017564 [Dermacentor silvarum]|uniref:Uncharacterized protein n=1 Tax=Dermacentor silvarum TaxID=543639 RepID=A0ACB8D774_DERSI|nr:hypothetical protein HPB49_017564 [Dermacentor silvarum]
MESFRKPQSLPTSSIRLSSPTKKKKKKKKGGSVRLSPEFFQQTSERVFKRQLTVKLYFGDVLVASQNIEGQAADLRNVLTMARGNNLNFNEDKLQLSLPITTHLGHQLTPKRWLQIQEKERPLKTHHFR